MWWLSNFIIMGSSAAYARIRQMEMDAAKGGARDNDREDNFKDTLLLI